MRSYDLIVVGAGPGGSVAAMRAAELGLSTLLIERGREPGDKNASGCGLGPRAFRDFDFIRALDNEACPSLRAGTALRHYLIDAEDRHVSTVVTKPTESVGYEAARRFITLNVYRSDLDPHLARLAQAAGAELVTATLVTDVLREGGKVTGVVDERGTAYRGRVVVGADGAVSTVARLAGLRERWRPEEVTLVAQVDYRVPAGNIERVLGDETLAIWWGVNFPTAYQVFFADGFHIGLGNWLGRFDKSPAHYLRRVTALPRFEELVRALDATPREIQAHLLPWTEDPGVTFTDNVLLVGDAAGFACPLEAEGVYPAMLTGRIAAEVAAEAIRDGDTSREALSLYETRWRQSSVGIELETGPELVRLWKDLPFNPRENMSWFVPMVSEVLGGPFDWSEPHAVRAQQIYRRLSSLWPRAAPFVANDVIPFLRAALAREPGTGPLRLGLGAIAALIRLTAWWRRLFARTPRDVEAR